MIIEGDSQQVIRALVAKDHEGLAYSMIVQNTQALLVHFLEWSVRHVRRESNKVAHWLAKDALLISYYIVNMEDPPQCIIDLLVNEQLT